MSPRRNLSRTTPAAIAALFLAIAFASSSPLNGQQAEREGTLGFYRFPDLSGQTLVFAAEGDLWRVPVSGGLAQRLTTHPAEERHPRFSPDGATLAFTAQYEGPSELYTMSSSGGLPRRHTFEADASIATTWTPGGEVVYTTTGFATLPKPQLVRLNLDDQRHTRVPLAEGSEASYSDDGRTLYFVRPAFHNNVTKRYTGGTARDVWKFVEGSAEAVELTGDYEGESHSPMWWDGRVYFVSDRDGTMNLWSMNGDGGDVRQHTTHSGWDVKNPSLDAGRVVYQLGADLWLYDVATGQAGSLPITLASDSDQLREKWADANEFVTSVALHPKGESVVLTSRGRVLVAPVGDGRRTVASTTQGVRYRDAGFLPDGRIYTLSDASGELEWVTLPADGVGPETPLTRDAEILRFGGAASPTGDRVAYTDNNSDLWILENESGRSIRVNANREGLAEYAWSPDGRWLAYSEVALNSFAQLFVYDTQTGESTAVTSDRTNSFAPAWGPDGASLYFLSDRRLVSLVGAPWGPRQPEPYFDKSIEIYHVALQAGGGSPFAPRTELTAATDAVQADGPTTVSIDLEGIERRGRRVPVEAGNYSSLHVNPSALFYLSRGSGPSPTVELMSLPITNDGAEPVAMLENARGLQLSLDGTKLLIRQRQDVLVADARPVKLDPSESRVNLSDWTFPIDVREDWRQIFVDAWRLERDYFYDPGMHGVDWDGVRDKYLPLIDRVTTRDELSDLIGRVVGELSALHTSVRGGDVRTGSDNVRVASLGARFSKTDSGFRIDYVYQSDPDYPEEMSPLADPYLGVDEGDVIEAVNGTPTATVAHIGSLLRNQVDQQVRLTIRSANTGEARDVIVAPTGDERNLRYSDWQYTRRVRADEGSDGQIGYVHLRAMSGDNLTEWYRQFYPVWNRPGLIIDVRRNSGGNIDSFILEKLMRQAWMWFKGRTGEPYPNMMYAPIGHMVVLVDQNTASDGEAFADGFRRLGLGKVIGKRTWGGEIWLGSQNRLTDMGLARAPMSGVYADGEWLIEQIGVVPDIVVDNPPHATFNGADAQLEAAIEYLLAEMERDPRTAPQAPAYPNRGFRYNADGQPNSNPSARGGGRPGGR